MERLLARVVFNGMVGAGLGYVAYILAVPHQIRSTVLFTVALVVGAVAFVVVSDRPTLLTQLLGVFVSAIMGMLAAMLGFRFWEWYLDIPRSSHEPWGFFIGLACACIGGMLWLRLNRTT